MSDFGLNRIFFEISSGRQQLGIPLASPISASWMALPDFPWRDFHILTASWEATMNQKRFSVVLLLLALCLGIAQAQSTSKAKSSTTTSSASGARIDLNSASQSDLESLSGVGAASAKKIIAGRPYSSASDLSKAGVSQKPI